MNAVRLEREAADRHSLAGMALAHADASAELRSCLETSEGALETSEARKMKDTGEGTCSFRALTALEVGQSRITKLGVRPYVSPPPPKKEKRTCYKYRTALC